MKRYLIAFYNKGVKICTYWKDGKNKEEAVCKAEFIMTTKYPNISYDDIRVAV